MSETKVPQIFNDAAQALARLRAQTRMAASGPSFLLTRAAEDAASRIADIARTFKRGVVLSPIDIREVILSDLPERRQPKTLDWVDGIENMVGEYDLVISLLELQTENDLPGVLLQIRRKLSPDGLFITAMFGGDSLSDLRRTLYAVDSAVFGGAAARIYPMIDHQQAAALLGRAGLNLPVVDKDRVAVTYRQLKTLINDLRDLGLTNTLMARHTARLPKGYLDAVDAAYPKTDDGHFEIQFEIIWLTGWAPHENQQKPLKPGSAKMRLADALGVSEKKV